MSEEETRDISKKYDTKPTIETVLERIGTLEVALNQRLEGFETGANDRFQKFEDRIDVRLDRIESEVKLTHSELFSLRADFRELKSEIGKHFSTT